MTPSSTRVPAAGSRPRARDGSSKPEQTILRVTEELLQETAFADVTVADILKAAGISRANFYHYYASKHDVLAGLLRHVLSEAYEDAGPWKVGPGPDRARSMGASLRSTLDLWAQHGTVMCAAIEWMHEVPAVAAAWATMRDRFVDAVAEQVEHQRAELGDPHDLDPRLLATILVCGVERTFYVSHRGLEPRLPSPEHIVTSMEHLVWLAIHRGALPGPGQVPPDVPPAAVGAADGQPDVRPETSGMEQSILDGLADLLRETPIQDVSVARILERAGASRATFYFYFSSKDDVFLALYRQVALQLVSDLPRVLEGHRSSAAAFVALFSRWLALDERSTAVFHNAVHEWPRQPVLRDAYLADHSRMVDALAGALAAERRDGAGDGAGDDGPSVDEFAATLLWTVERTIAGMLSEEPGLTSAPEVTRHLGSLLALAFA